MVMPLVDQTSASVSQATQEYVTSLEDKETVRGNVSSTGVDRSVMFSCTSVGWKYCMKEFIRTFACLLSKISLNRIKEWIDQILGKLRHIASSAASGGRGAECPLDN